MIEPAYEIREAYEYECFDCGEMVMAVSNPGSCPEWGTSMRDRPYPVK
jgi:hypothetical protein